jgi:hypothetical protein
LDPDTDLDPGTAFKDFNERLQTEKVLLWSGRKVADPESSRKISYRPLVIPNVIVVNRIRIRNTALNERLQTEDVLLWSGRKTAHPESRTQISYRPLVIPDVIAVN